MKHIAISLLCGLVACLVLGGAYAGALYWGVRLDATQVVVGAALLAFASSTAVFALFALNRPVAKTPYQRTRLNEMPAMQKVSLFDDPDKIRIFARPEQSLAEILARFGDAFKKPSSEVDSKKIVLTLKGSKKAEFNPVILRALFATLAPYKLEHVLLLNADSHLAGYIPGDRALKDFNAPNAEAKISDAIVKTIASPADTKALRAMNGMTPDDVVNETDDIRHAAVKFYANDAVPGLVVHKQLRPIGVISKVDLLVLTSSEPMIAGY